jgi:ATP-dependent exoDNAse (exonuclease V) beta subunit
MGSSEEFGSQVMEEGDVDRVFGDAWQGLINAFTEGKSLDWLEQRLLASKRRSMEYPLLVARKNGITDLQEEPLICVGSIHSTKGSESDVVYLLPDLSPSGMREFTRPEGRDGLIRTFYVGMTRARERLVLVGRWSSAAMNWNG